LVLPDKTIFFYTQISVTASKNFFGEVFSKFVFLPYIVNREAIEEQNKYFGKLSKVEQNRQYHRTCFKISNLGHIYNNIYVTSKQN